MSETLRARLERLLELERANRLLGPRRPWHAAVVVALLVVWQLGFALDADRLEPEPRLRAAQGWFLGEARDLAYFWHHLGLFPAASTERAREDTAAGAQALLRGRPDTVQTEVGCAVRFGELGRYALLLPWAWITGRTADARPVVSNAAGFVAGLALLWLAAWRAGQPALGLLLVLLLGSNPFQLGEVFQRDNVFCWPINTLLLLLALCLPTLVGRGPTGRRLWLVPLAAGLVLATVRQVRQEPVALVASAAAVLLLCPRGDEAERPARRWSTRIGLLLTLLAALQLGSWGWRAYFRGRIEHASRVVHAAGGHVFPIEQRQAYHPLWHSLYCGLGDFGGDRGYVWDDRVAYAHAAPQLAALGYPPWIGGYYLRGSWDPAGRFLQKPEELADYDAILRKQLLGEAPSWLAGIVARRAARVVLEASPTRLAVARWSLPLPNHGLLAVAVLGALAWLRRWRLVGLVLFPAPLAATAIVVHSGGGTIGYVCVHLVAFALLAAVGLEAALAWRERRRAAGTDGGSSYDAPSTR